MKPLPFDFFIIPIFALLCSGWFIVAYLVMKPGYDAMMLSLPAGTTLNIVSPTLWLYITLVFNMVAWLGSAMIYLKGDEE